MNKKEVEKDLKEKDLTLEKCEVQEKDLLAKDLKTENLEEVEKDFTSKEAEKDFELSDIKKLKCDYTIYKEERTKKNMPILTKCQKCGGKFKDKQNLYVAKVRNNENIIICEKCVKQD